MTKERPLPDILSGARKMLAPLSATENMVEFDNETDSSTQKDRKLNLEVAKAVIDACAVAGDAGIAQYARTILEPILQLQRNHCRPLMGWGFPVLPGAMGQIMIDFSKSFGLFSYFFSIFRFC